MSKPLILGTVLQEMIDREGLRPGINATRAIETWAFIAGPKINGITDRVAVRNGKMYVQIQSASWRQQLHMQRTEWKDRLNRELGEEIISEIVFR